MTKTRKIKKCFRYYSDKHNMRTNFINDVTKPSRRRG